MNDPVGTGIRLGEGYVQPFATAARQLAAGQTFEGTATATEAGADIIVRAATGGAGFVVNLLNRGPNVNVPDAPRTSGGTANSASGERLTDDLIASMDRPQVSDPTLSRALDRLYRPGGTVGNGSTAAAVREELRTGVPVRGRQHSQKAENEIVNLERFIRRNPNASPSDIRAAQNVIRDLRNALGGN